MSEQGESGSGQPHEEEEPFVRDLVPNPGQPPDATMLVGYIGRSSADGIVRMYLTRDLSVYAEIPTRAILHSRKLPEDRGTAVWVAGIQNVRVTLIESIEAQFLQGPIVAANLTPTMWAVRAALGTLSDAYARRTYMCTARCSSTQYCIVGDNGESGYDIPPLS